MLVKDFLKMAIHSNFLKSPHTIIKAGHFSHMAKMVSIKIKDK
jgi:hypothetical protein